MKSVLYLLWKWIISDNKFCLLTQCAKSKISSLYVVAKPSLTCTITFMFYIWKCLEKHVFLEHVHWVHIQYTFLALFFKILSEYSVQTICQLQTCHVLHVAYCPSYLNVLFSILTSISIGQVFLFSFIVIIIVLIFLMLLDY